MKISSIVTRWQPLMCILLVFASQPVVAYSNVTIIGQTQASESAPVPQDVTPISPENSPIIAHKKKSSTSISPTKNTTLNDEPRGKLSVFLGIGIGINIIMAIVFAWWFSREWRKPRNIGGSRHVD